MRGRPPDPVKEGMMDQLQEWTGMDLMGYRGYRCRVSNADVEKLYLAMLELHIRRLLDEDDR